MSSEKIVMCENGGCLAKVGGGELANLLNRSFGTYRPEDCAEFHVDDSKLLYTMDFGPLIGEDPLIAGKIAALHAISDVYACNGEPLYALVVLQITNHTTFEQAGKVLEGIHSVCKELGISVLGGHTIRSEELIAGLSLVGKARDKQSDSSKNNCRDGDVLMVSKAFGTGLASRAYFHKLITYSDYSEALNSMLTPNKIALNAFEIADVHACTDVTGFGLLGHLSEMLSPEQGAAIRLDQIRTFRCIGGLSAAPFMTKYIENNIDYILKAKKCNIAFDDIGMLSLVDPQTNGPILISVPENDVAKLVDIGFYPIGKVNKTARLEVV